MLWMPEVKHPSSGAGSALGLRLTESSARRDLLLPGTQKGVALDVVELDDQASLFEFGVAPSVSIVRHQRTVPRSHTR